ncbi:hypothetical protein Pcinc_020667 [Petrolisthes cinctipes]|uniref:Uncharacterized protein n=1 Tax=Petrolisthes cinctipes TaxID=88211 RepID=A0AAE1KJL6_PETCI|nr:hypothetical protein Pcinc_020667 [Petrolisthes cinctipes]
MPKVVARYRRALVKQQQSATATPTTKKKRRSTLLHLLRDGGEGKAMANIFKKLTSFVRDIEMYYDDNELPSSLRDKLAADPYVNTSSIFSKFAKLYSPMHAKASWSAEQLITASPFSMGSTAVSSTSTALVLPTGHMVNKALFMTEKDIETLTL